MKKTLFICLILTLMVVTSACSSKGTDAKEDELMSQESQAPIQTEPEEIIITASGTLKEIYDADGDITGFFISEGEDKESSYHYTSAYVNITEETEIMTKNESEAKAEDLKLGQQIEVIFTGPLTKSVPPQGNAETIIIN